MFGTLISFCLMAVGARELSGQVNTFQIMFFRSVLGLIVISLLIGCAKTPQFFRSKRLALHVVRNLFHFAGQYGWLLGISLLPLAEVFALEFTVPLWTALIAFIFLKEIMTTKKMVSIFLGTLGVAVIVQPGIRIIDVASLTVLASAACYAISHVSTKSLSSTESPLTILFFMCLIQLPVGLLFSLANWESPVGIAWFWMTVIGLTALSAHFCMTKAMQYAEVTAIVTMDFFRLPVIGLIGVLFYSENFELTLIIGAVLMLAGNLMNVFTPRASRNS
jgi:drug/metabolite transporter (DMT)-like permease